MMAREWHQVGPDAAHNRKPQGTPMRVIRSRRRRRWMHRWLHRWLWLMVRGLVPDTS